MKTKHFFLYFSLALFLLGCSDNDGEKYALGLDETSVSIDISGGEKQVILAANDEWYVEDIPEWLTVTPSKGGISTSTTIAIVATENVDLERRDVSLQFICGNMNRTLKIEQQGLIDLDPFMDLSENTLSMLYKGEEKKIQLTTNIPWKITGLPQWISVNPVSGNKSTEITITAAENPEPQQRSITLTFGNDKAEDILTVNQSGYDDYLRIPSLPIFSFESVSFTGAEDEYDISTFNLFVNPDIKDRIYLGNLIDYHAGLPNTQIPTLTGYTFNPITISTSAFATGIKSKTYVPSLSEQQAYAQEIIAKNPSQQVSFLADNGNTNFYDYKRLHTIGIANLGIKLDELVSGSSHTTTEMAKKYGLIFSFKQTWFSLDMDYPEKLIVEELKDGDKNKGVAYVSSVFYGRIGLLIVESDTFLDDIKAAINNAISGKTLSASETSMIEQSDISYVYFDNKNQVQVKKGKLDAVNAYKEAILKGNTTENVHPVGFGISNFSDYSMTTITFSFKVTK